MMNGELDQIEIDSITNLLQKLIVCVIRTGLLKEIDRIYAYNRMLNLLGLDSGTDIIHVDPAENDTGDIIESIVSFAVEKALINNLFDHKEVLAAELMNCMMARPSEIDREFKSRFSRHPRLATDWFYSYCEKSQYIQTKRIKHNVSYQAQCEYGTLDITINLSKPEKNPADIAAERLIQSSNYPKCLLCAENEGYSGGIGHPARANHRLISLPELGGEQWYLQYSPYLYYNEHCIVLSAEHRPMKIDRTTFTRMISFLDFFPHYFIGSNADLPIVGGSILSHDHYQGGQFSFAMDRAKIEKHFSMRSFDEVKAGIVRWPMSVIRLRSKSRQQIIDCADVILTHWRSYSDVNAKIISATEDEPHNTITPIARMRKSEYELDLVLRNNRCTDEHPLGIFHPHADVHHIKQENIGLIEVMGLAVLPARLVKELREVSDVLSGKATVADEKHSEWANMLTEKYGRCCSTADAEMIVRKETAIKFERVLADAGVFKRNQQGAAAFDRYAAEIGRL